MLNVATRVLRLRSVQPPAPDGTPGEQSMLDFVAYARHYTLTGTLSLTADRLTDLLNGADELDLADVVYLGFDGHVQEADHAVIERSDLIAVKAGNPRGNATLRHRTRQVPVVVGAAEYVMHGYLHSRPGADPLVHFGRRPPMVPLTESTIIYRASSEWRRDQASTLIVNRDAADWIRPARDDELARIAARAPAA